MKIMQESVREEEVLFYQNSKSERKTERLLVEAPLQIIVNYLPYMITMRTPNNDEAFVRGLMLSEGIISLKDSDYPIKVTQREKNVAVSIKIEIEPHKIQKAINDNRSLITSSSCGICGKKDLDELRIQTNKRNLDKQFSSQEILNLFSLMETKQEIFQRTGACHAAAAFGKNGKLLSLGEDVGRHNAVDKVIGALLMENALEKAAILLVSGRVSYEIVSKAITAGIPAIAAVSAASSLAIETAKEHQIKLYGFCRKNRLTEYC